MKTIAVIEDDESIGSLLTETLTEEGYRVLRAYSGTEALLLLERQMPDLILLDLMLPGLAGEELLSRYGGIPVIVVSAKAEIDGKIRLLQNGAVDYVTKPFNIRELLARIAIHLRNARLSENSLLHVDELCLNPMSRELLVADTPVYLTKTEFAILKILMQNAPQVVSKSALLDKISLETPDCMESSLKVHVSNLRRKLKNAGGREYIETVWGIGFKMIPKE